MNTLCRETEVIFMSWETI